MNQGWTKDLNVQTTEYPFFEFFKKTIITRDDNIPYLIRWTLFRFGKYFSVKLHKIVQSDDACMHDHPWPFLSIILKGGYFEWMVRTLPGIKYRAGRIAADGRTECKAWFKPGSILHRSANWAHRLELKTDEKGNPIPCWTLIFTGAVCRKWGFFTPKGWVYWRNYSRKENC